VLPRQLDFIPERDAEIFASVAAAPAVFLLRGSDPSAEPYVSKTANLRRRLIRLLAAPEGTSRRLNLRDRVARIEYAPTGSDFESGYVLYKLLREVFPRNYQDRLRFRPAPLVRFHLENRFPRVSVTAHLSGHRAGSVFYGPFPSRAAAEKFSNDALDFFKIRRCVEELNPDPAHPGCVYSEMKMCLAPCFKGCSDQEYAAEVGRVQQFFETGGHSLVREIERQRDDASTNLDFEAAAALHIRLEKVKAAAAQLPSIMRRLDDLNGVMVQPSADRESVALFKIAAGRICAPVALNVGQPAGAAQIVSKPQSQSMESRVAEALAAVEAPKLRRALEWMEHLALLKRWYYRTIKVGELFLADDGELPMRRVVRGVSRVFRGEKPAGDLSDTAGDYWKFRAREAGLTES
jgi:excinuclease ABC subunit C